MIVYNAANVVETTLSPDTMRLPPSWLGTRSNNDDNNGGDDDDNDGDNNNDENKEERNVNRVARTVLGFGSIAIVQCTTRPRAGRPVSAGDAPGPAIPTITSSGSFCIP